CHRSRASSPLPFPLPLYLPQSYLSQVSEDACQLSPRHRIHCRCHNSRAALPFPSPLSLFFRLSLSISPSRSRRHCPSVLLHSLIQLFHHITLHPPQHKRPQNGLHAPYQPLVCCPPLSSLVSSAPLEPHPSRSHLLHFRHRLFHHICFHPPQHKRPQNRLHAPYQPLVHWPPFLHHLAHSPSIPFPPPPLLTFCTFDTSCFITFAFTLRSTNGPRIAFMRPISPSSAGPPPLSRPPP
ncbi:unnamed protein product, partial [Closterium sp. NIES-54]